jgi:hypothetical protein
MYVCINPTVCVSCVCFDKLNNQAGVVSVWGQKKLEARYWAQTFNTSAVYGVRRNLIDHWNYSFCPFLIIQVIFS